MGGNGYEARQYLSQVHLKVGAILPLIYAQRYVIAYLAISWSQNGKVRKINFVS